MRSDMHLHMETCVLQSCEPCLFAGKRPTQAAALAANSAALCAQAQRAAAAGGAAPSAVPPAQPSAASLVPPHQQQHAAAAATAAARQPTGQSAAPFRAAPLRLDAEGREIDEAGNIIERPQETVPSLKVPSHHRIVVAQGSCEIAAREL